MSSDSRTLVPFSLFPRARLMMKSHPAQVSFFPWNHSVPRSHVSPSPFTAPEWRGSDNEVWLFGYYICSCYHSLQGASLCICSGVSISVTDSWLYAFGDQASPEYSCLSRIFYPSLSINYGQISSWSLFSGHLTCLILSFTLRLHLTFRPQHGPSNLQEVEVEREWIESMDSFLFFGEDTAGVSSYCPFWWSSQVFG